MTSRPMVTRLQYRWYRWLAALILCTLPWVLAACDSGGGGTNGDPPTDGELNCTIPPEDFIEGANRGAIDAIDNPALVGVDEAEEILSGFSDTDRIIALPSSFHSSFSNTPLAIPLDVLFEHEVMNLDDWASRPLVITFCPLTSSTLVFDRSVVDGTKFNVSGLLLNRGNQDHPGNLVMVDERDGESLWPQMSRRSTCGPNRGTDLTMLPAMEIQWGRWKELHPDTRVAVESSASGSSARSQSARASASSNGRATAKVEEVPPGRVLGIPNRTRTGGGKGGLALAFEDLDGDAAARAIEITVNQEDVVVFWDREARAAMAFATTESFSVQDGQIVDNQTQSVWTVDGRAIEGPRTGETLTPVTEAYIATGSAWFDFQPDSELWDGSS